MLGDRGNVDSLILINTTNAGRHGGNMDSLILIYITYAGRQGKYGLTHIN